MLRQGASEHSKLINLKGWETVFRSHSTLEDFDEP